MEESILQSVKKFIGPDTNYDYFDSQIIMHINSAISKLTQIGVGPKNGFKITGPDELWSDFYQEDKLSMVQDYVCIKAKLVFDPPLNSSVLEELKQEASEDFWRLSVEVDK